MFGIGGMEFVLILVVALVVLGPDHLPRVMRMVGKTVGELRRASTEFQRTMNTEMAQSEKDAEEPVPAPKQTPEAVPAPAPALDVSETPEQGASPKAGGVQAASRRRAVAKPLRRSTQGNGGEKQ